MRNFLTFFLIIFLAILQAAMAPHLRFFGAVPNFVFAAILISAIRGNKLIFLEAFLAGLMLDVFSGLPFGVFSLSLPLLISAFKFIGKRFFLTGEFSGRISLFAVSSLLFSLLYIFLAYLLQGFSPGLKIEFWRSLLSPGLVEAFYNFILALAGLFLLRRQRKFGL
jgi:rod shape-determining protein MreD